MSMNKLFLITGGNLADRQKNLELAQKLIEERIGPIEKSSKIYETEAWGNRDQPAFYNQVHVVKTKLTSLKVLEAILQIEKEMGRKRTVKNAARIIDIDILFYNNDIVNEQNLQIPHPHIADRRFVLLPLSELAPKFVHPVLKKTIDELISITGDQLKVKALS
jgi:2-amino-4-hydroxy-6-hydroxymethyldihydropteridine diphosphokinase